MIRDVQAAADCGPDPTFIDDPVLRGGRWARDLAGDPALPPSNLYRNQRLRNVKLVRDDLCVVVGVGRRPPQRSPLTGGMPTRLSAATPRSAARLGRMWLVVYRISWFMLIRLAPLSSTAWADRRFLARSWSSRPGSLTRTRAGRTCWTAAGRRGTAVHAVVARARPCWPVGGCGSARHAATRCR
jgi:hypothetical protein